MQDNMKKEKFKIWWHGSKEKDKRPYWRGWLYFGSKVCFSVDLILFARDFRLDIGRGSSSVKFHLGIPFLFMLYLNFGGILPHGEAKMTGFYFSDNAIWWHFWQEPMNGKFGVFHFDDFLFGKSECVRTVLDERDILVPMPEKAYEAHAKLMLYQWKRPRWFTKEFKRVEIDVPEGLPMEGKGENSWDCGKDATFGITTGQCNTIAEGVGILVGSVLKDRIKYGGWGDWNWQKT